MREGTQLKYGPIMNEAMAVKIPGWPIGASEVIKAASGRFVKYDASQRLEIAVDGTTLLAGWLEIGEQTASSTEGGTLGTLIPAANCPVVFRIPINAGTFVATMRGKTCDLAVTSSIQGAKLDGSGEDTLLIVDGDLENNLWVDVMIAPDKQASFTGVV